MNLIIEQVFQLKETRLCFIDKYHIFFHLIFLLLQFGIKFVNQTLLSFRNRVLVSLFAQHFIVAPYDR